jgi:GTP pyrophosphokinase
MLRILDGLRVDDAARAAACLFAAAAFVPGVEDQIEHALARKWRGGKALPGCCGSARSRVTQADVSRRRSRRWLRGRSRSRRCARCCWPFAQDIRVVLVRLASRLQTLRWLAQTKPAAAGRGARTLDLAPLANRLGIWQMKWELEDLVPLRATDDLQAHRQAARRKAHRARRLYRRPSRLQSELAAAASAPRSGRPKHIYSIWKKMRGKELDFADLYDVRAFRVIVDDQGLLHGAGHRAPHLAARSRGVRRLFAAEGQRLQVAAHGGDRRRRPGARSADPHARDASLRRVRRGRALALQGSRRQGLQRPVCRRQAYDEKIAWLRQLLAWKDDADPPSRTKIRRGSSSSMRRSTTASMC